MPDEEQKTSQENEQGAHPISHPTVTSRVIRKNDDDNNED